MEIFYISKFQANPIHLAIPLIPLSISKDCESLFKAIYEQPFEKLLEEECCKALRDLVLDMPTKEKAQPSKTLCLISEAEQVTLGWIKCFHHLLNEPSFLQAVVSYWNLDVDTLRDEDRQALCVSMLVQKALQAIFNVLTVKKSQRQQFGMRKTI